MRFPIGRRTGYRTRKEAIETLIECWEEPEEETIAEKQPKKKETLKDLLETQELGLDDDEKHE